MSPAIATLGPQIRRVLMVGLVVEAVGVALLGPGLTGAWVGIVVGGCPVALVLAVRLKGHLTPVLDGRSPATAVDGTMPA